jgi:hypothetical protein
MVKKTTAATIEREMAEERWCDKVDREAGEKLEALLALPLDDGFMSTGECFEPWSLFPCVYGSYSGDFDKCAIDALTELVEGKKRRSDLGAEMFREMLCNAHLCDYGTSPRVCFPTREFLELLPVLLEKWKAHSLAYWGQDVTLEKQ